MQNNPSNRRSCGKAWQWSAVVEEFEHWVRAQPDNAPLLELSRTIAGLETARQLFPGVSYDGLLITNVPEFYRDDNVLFVTHFPAKQQFRLQFRLNGEIRLEQFCSETKIIHSLATVVQDCWKISLISSS